MGCRLRQSRGLTLNDMIIFRRQVLSLFLLSTALASTPLLADTKRPAKLHPLPTSELEEVILGWLSRSGFDSHRTTLKMGQVQLKALKGEERWEVALKPHSPLATETQATYTVGNQPDERQLEKLWDYISYYVTTASTEASSEAIPQPVLSQIKSVVCITGKQDDKDIRLSGFIIDKEGLIVCTAHDLQKVQEITVIVYHGLRAKGDLIHIDPHRDLALLKIAFEPEASISLASGRNLLEMGERLYAIGCPNDLEITTVSGIIDAPPRRANDQSFWQINMQIHPGSSGSPVFDAEGNLVAVVKGRYRGTDSFGFLIPVETLLKFLKERPHP